MHNEQWACGLITASVCKQSIHKRSLHCERGHWLVKSADYGLQTFRHRAKVLVFFWSTPKQEKRERGRKRRKKEEAKDWVWGKERKKISRQLEIRTPMAGIPARAEWNAVYSLQEIPKHCRQRWGLLHRLLFLQIAECDVSCSISHTHKVSKLFLHEFD